MEHGFFEQLTAVVTAIVVWLTGETGRIVIAGSAGGLARWTQNEVRRLRDGVIAVAGGALAATYLWPVTFYFLSFIMGQMEKSLENVAMSAFLTGALGMSFVKLLTAAIETVLRGRGNGGT